MAAATDLESWVFAFASESFHGHPLMTWALCALLVFARLAPLAVIAPFVAGRLTAATWAGPLAGAALLFGLTLGLLPVAVSHAPSSLGWNAALLFLALRELLLGALFAVAVGLPLWAMEWAGALVDLFRGVSPGDGSGEGAHSPLGDMYLLLGLALFVSIGGHRAVVEALSAGFVHSPVGTLPASPSWGDVALGAARQMQLALVLALSVAAPALMAIILVELALGLVGRAAPQASLFFESFSLRAATALVAMLLAMSMLVPHLREALSQAIRTASLLLGTS